MNPLLYIYIHDNHNDCVYDLVAGEILMALDSVSGRKHPSTIQVKQLKSTLPMMPVLQHFITSQVRATRRSHPCLPRPTCRHLLQVFRARITNEAFVKTLGQLLTHVHAIDSGNTHIQAAAGTQSSLQSAITA